MEEAKNAVEITETKSYELRPLIADDIFPMFQILSKVGIKEFKTCFESTVIKDMVKKAAANNTAVDTTAVGMMIALDIAGILFANLPKAKDDIYLLLSQLSGMSKKAISTSSPATLMQMIVDVVQKEEFKDFFQVVFKLFK